MFSPSLLLDEIEKELKQVILKYLVCMVDYSVIRSPRFLI